MPGAPLDIDYPATGDTTTEALDKLVAAIETIESDLEAKVAPGEIDMTSALDMKGNQVLNCGGVELDDTAATTGQSAGTVYYAGGELRVQTSSGAVQLTSGGALNSVSLGNWGGDYGTDNAEAIWEAGVPAFEFYEDSGEYGDLSANGIFLQNADVGTDNVKLVADTSVAGQSSYKFKSQSNGAAALFEVSSSGVVEPKTTVTAACTWSSAQTFNGNVAVNGTATMAAASVTGLSGLTVTGTATAGAFTTAAAVTAATGVFSGDVTVGGDLNLNGAGDDLKLGAWDENKVQWTSRTRRIPLDNVTITAGTRLANIDRTTSGAILATAGQQLEGYINFRLEPGEQIDQIYLQYRSTAGSLTGVSFNLYATNGVTEESIASNSGTIAEGFGLIGDASVTVPAEQSAIGLRYVLEFVVGSALQVSAGDGIYLVYAITSCA